MKISAIRKLVNDADLASLKATEEDLMEERPLQLEVEGEDEGEQLTHILAAIWILEEMEKKGLSAKEGIRAYTTRVRNSIS